MPQLRLYPSERLADNPSCAASFHCAADFFGGDDAKTVDPPFRRLKIAYEGAVYNACTLFKKIAEFSVFFYAYIFFGIVHSLVRKSCSALIASASDYLSSVGGRHSFSEAVFHFSLALLRLISSFHFSHSFPFSSYLCQNKGSYGDFSRQNARRAPLLYWDSFSII